MGVLSLVPLPDSIPVPWGWFQALLLGTFTCHLLLMNAVLGGGLFLLFAGKDAGPVGRRLAKRLPTGLALTVNLGVPPLLFLQVLYGQFLYTSSVLTAVYWLSAVGLTMLAYVLMYGHAGQPEAPDWRRLFLPGAVAALLLVSLIMTNTMTLVQRPEAWAAYFKNPAGTILNIADPTFLPRWLHFLLASAAVGGLFAALVASKTTPDPDEARAAGARGLKWFTHASLLQILAGGWWLMSLPQEVMLRFMGASGLATAVFLAALGAAALAIAMGFQGRGQAAAWSVGLTVALMTGVRELSRTAMLGESYRPDSYQVTGQYGPMILFAVSLVLGLAAIAYMLRLHWRAGGRI